MIRIESAVKTYFTTGVATHALRGASATIERGEHVAIRGPSGSGKTTLLNLIGLLDVPTSGEILLDGKPTAKLSERDRAGIRNRTFGFVFQSYNLIPELKAWENVALPGRYGRLPRGERRELAVKLLDRVGLSERVKNRPAQLSGGEEQRVAVARALLMSPLVVLADEPTGNLDSATGESILDLFDSLNEEGTTIVAVTHSDEVAYRASRAIHLMDGTVVDPPFQTDRF